MLTLLLRASATQCLPTAGIAHPHVHMLCVCPCVMCLLHREVAKEVLDEFMRGPVRLEWFASTFGHSEHSGYRLHKQERVLLILIAAKQAYKL